MNHIPAENMYFRNHTEWTEQKIMGFKPPNKNRIIQQYHSFKNKALKTSTITRIIHFIIEQKFCKHFLQSPK